MLSFLFHFSFFFSSLFFFFFFFFRSFSVLASSVFSTLERTSKGPKQKHNTTQQNKTVKRRKPYNHRPNPKQHPRRKQPRRLEPMRRIPLIRPQRERGLDLGHGCHDGRPRGGPIDSFVFRFFCFVPLFSFRCFDTRGGESCPRWSIEDRGLKKEDGRWKAGDVPSLFLVFVEQWL